jgi:hypothetical protein
VIKLTLYTLYGWGVAFLPAAVYLGKRVRQRPWLQSWQKPLFLLLWVGPALFYYALIHMGQQGLAFVFLPALLLLSAFGLTQSWTARPAWQIAAAAAVISLSVGIFCLMPEYPLGPGTQRLLTRATLVNSDEYYQQRFELIRKRFPQESTAILAANWHHVEYYLPNYVGLRFSIGAKWERDEGIPENNYEQEMVVTPAQLGLQPGPSGQTAIVIFDADLSKFNDTPELADRLSLPDGGQLEYMTLQANDQLHLKANSFSLSKNQ